MYDIINVETGEILFTDSNFEVARQWVLDNGYKFVRCCEVPNWISDSEIAVVE